MRLSLGVLVCLGVGGLAAAVADEANSPAAPAATPAEPAAPPTAPATPPAAATPVATNAEQSDRHLLSEGYHAEMHDGQKIYCRKEEVLGSRLEGKRTCGTSAELMLREEQSNAATDRAQRTGGVAAPKGRP